MLTRSQWFLTPSIECTSCGGSLDLALADANVSALTNALLRKSSSGTIGIAYFMIRFVYIHLKIINLF